MTVKPKKCITCGKMLFTITASDICFLCKRKLLFMLDLPLGHCTVKLVDNTLKVIHKIKG